MKRRSYLSSLLMFTLLFFAANPYLQFGISLCFVAHYFRLAVAFYTLNWFNWRLQFRRFKIFNWITDIFTVQVATSSLKSNKKIINSHCAYFKFLLNYPGREFYNYLLSFINHTGLAIVIHNVREVNKLTSRLTIMEKRLINLSIIFKSKNDYLAIYTE